MCTFRPRFLDHQTTEAQHHVTLGLAELGQPLDGKALHDAIARGKDHPYAVRILARAWLSIWHCQQHHTA